MKFHSRLIVLIASATLAGHAMAEETRFSMSVGATWSDNVGRTSTDEDSELMPEAGLILAVNREGRLDADISADLQYRGYSDDAFDDELLGGLNARLGFEFVPDRLSWIVEDNFGQSFIDPQQVETPDNRQNLNYFSTGPDVLLPLGSRTQLSISGRWSDVNYEEGDIDSQRLSGVVGLIRSMSAASSMSVNVSAQRVEFDESPPNSDYDMQSAYLGYQAKGARTSLSVRGGYTTLRDFGESSDGPLLDLSLTRSLGSRSSLTLNVGTQFYDSAESFRREREFIDVVVGNEDVIPSRDPFQQDYAIAIWSIAGARSTLNISADWRSEDHETDTALDRKRVAGSANLSRRLGSRVSASLFGSYSNEDYDVGNVDFGEWSAGAGLEWSLSSSIAVSLRGEHYDGSGDTSAGSNLRDYSENRYTLRLTYSPGR